MFRDRLWGLLFACLKCTPDAVMKMPRPVTVLRCIGVTPVFRVSRAWSCTCPPPPSPVLHLLSVLELRKGCQTATEELQRQRRRGGDSVANQSGSETRTGCWTHSRNGGGGAALCSPSVSGGHRAKETVMASAPWHAEASEPARYSSPGSSALGSQSLSLGSTQLSRIKKAADEATGHPQGGGT